MPDIAAWELVALTVVVAAGATVQASIGFGFALVSTPVLSLLAPETVPVTLLILAAPLNLVVAARERHAFDATGATQIIAGMLAGTVVAVAVLRALSPDLLTVAFGAAVVLAAGVSALRPGAALGPGIRTIAGGASGLVNTVAGTGGPFIALVYQHHPGPVVRATLAVTFQAAVVLSLAGQGAAGRLTTTQGVLALALLPALAVGLWAGRYGARAADVGWLRPAVLVFAAASGAGAMVKGLL